MPTKQTIAIIGATGQLGSALSQALATGPYRLLLHGNQPEALEAFVSDIRFKNAVADVAAAACPREAGWEADVIVLAVPLEAEAEVAAKIKEVANQKIVISVANTLNNTCDGWVTGPGTRAGEALQKQLPHSRVVKAFTTSLATAFAAPVIDGELGDVFVAGNDEEAVQTVVELVRTAGFTPLLREL